MSTIARPFGMLLMYLYEFVGNYGLALILFAIVIRIILLPFQMKGKRGMMRQSRLQPKMAELQKKHGTNKAKINEEMAKLYKEEGVSPMSGCLWSFIPLPIMIALFLAIRQPLTMMMGVAAELLEEGGAILVKLTELGFSSTMQSFYEQVDQARFISVHFDQFAALSENLRKIDFNFLGLDLGRQPEWNFLWTTDWGNTAVWVPGLALFFLPLLSAGSQFLATGINKKINPAGSPEGKGGQMQTMMMLMPLMSVYFGFIVPAALSLYWMMGTLLQIVQDVVLTKRYTKILDAEEEVRNEERKRKEAEIEAKRLETERRKAEGSIERNPNTSKRKKQKSEKQGQLDKAAEWEKKNAPPGESEKYEPGRVGNRRYARGRAYDPDRYPLSAVVPESDDDNEELQVIAGLPASFEEDSGEFREAEIEPDDEELADDEFEDDEDDEFEDDEDDEFGDDDDDEFEDDDLDDDDDDENDEFGDGENGDNDDPDAPPTVRFDTKRFDSDKDD